MIGKFIVGPDDFLITINHPNGKHARMSVPASYMREIPPEEIGLDVLQTIEALEREESK
jgi:hypothetical protein